MRKENTTNKGGNLDQPNVTESLALAGLFIKVENECPTCLGHSHVGKDCFNCRGEKKIISYKEIEFPTKEQIESEMKKRCTNWGGYFNGGEAKWFNRGARWMMNVLAGKAVTAKDNVR